MCWLATSSWRLFSSISLEQARVLDREHRLRGEGLQQVDRLLGNSPGSLAAHHQSADDALGAEQRHDQQRAKAGAHDDVENSDAGSSADRRICIGARCAAAWPMPASPMRICRSLMAAINPSLHAVGGAQAEFVRRLVENVDRAGVRAGELHRLGDDRVQHRLEVERGVDRLADLAQRAQLADRLRQLVGAISTFFSRSA